MTVGVAVTAKFPKSFWNDGSTSQPKIVASLFFQSNVPTTAFMLIGYDGLAVNFGNSKTAYFGAEGATIKYGT